MSLSLLSMAIRGSLSSGIASPTDYIHYYTMDAADITGDTITDLGTGAFNLTWSNTPTAVDIVTGQVGDAVDFATQGAAFASSNVTTEVSPTVFTYSIWLKSSHVDLQNAIGNLDAIPTNYYGFQLSQEWNTGMPHVYIAKGTGTALNADYKKLYATHAINDGSWHHVAVTYDDNKLIIYVDGIESSSATYGSGWCVHTATNHPFRLGKDASGGGQWLGDMDDCKIYDRALSADEVAAMYTADGGT